MKKEYLLEIKENLAFYGSTFETRKAMEEGAEYIQAINKCYCYGAKETQNLIEEIADVLITMEYVKSVFKIDNEDIELAIQKKINRQKMRREKEIKK